MTQARKLNATELYTHCDLSRLDFETTAEVPGVEIKEVPGPPACPKPVSWRFCPG